MPEPVPELWQYITEAADKVGRCAETGSVRLSLDHLQGNKGSSHRAAKDQSLSVPSYCVCGFMSLRLSVLSKSVIKIVK
jgi:hypothetical protein